MADAGTLATLYDNTRALYGLKVCIPKRARVQQGFYSIDYLHCKYLYACRCGITLADRFPVVLDSIQSTILPTGSTARHQSAYSELRMPLIVLSIIFSATHSSVLVWIKHFLVHLYSNLLLSLYSHLLSVSILALWTMICYTLCQFHPSLNLYVTA